MQPLAPIPSYDDLVDHAKKISGNWYRWLSDVQARLITATQTTASAHRPASSAIATTTVYTPTQPGVYRASWTIQVTTPATVNSSVAVTFKWTANGVAQTETFTALTANTTGTHGSGSVTIRPDTSTAIRYETAYASVGATSLAYTLDVTVEEIT